MEGEEPILIDRRSSALVVLPLFVGQVAWMFLGARPWYWPIGIVVVLAILFYATIVQEVRIIRGEFVWSWLLCGRKRILYRRVRLDDAQDVRVEESYVGPYMLRIARKERRPFWVGRWESQRDAESARLKLGEMFRSGARPRL